MHSLTLTCVMAMMALACGKSPGDAAAKIRADDNPPAPIQKLDESQHPASEMKACPGGGSARRDCSSGKCIYVCQDGSHPQ